MIDQKRGALLVLVLVNDSANSPCGDDVLMRHIDAVMGSISNCRCTRWTALLWMCVRTYEPCNSCRLTTPFDIWSRIVVAEIVVAVGCGVFEIHIGVVLLYIISMNTAGLEQGRRTQLQPTTIRIEPDT